MFKTIALLVILVAIVYSDDLSLSGDFNAESASLSWQTVKVNNELAGEEWSNALYDVSFSVSGDPLLLFSGLVSGRAQVGNILAGSSGTGKFGVICLASGRFDVTINVYYKKAGSDEVLNYSEEFVLAVDDDNWLMKKDGIKFLPNGVSAEATRSEAKRSLEPRQPGNNDAELTPTSYVSSNGAKTWNNFWIKAGNADLLNTTFNVYTIDDTSVAIFYPDDIGNNPGSIGHNVTYYTSIAFQGNTGIYYCNSSIRYRRTMMGSWKIFYMIYPLVITGDLSSFRAGFQKTLLTGSTNVSNLAIGLSVGGVALIAAVAVVAAVVVIRKKQEPVSV